MYKMFFDQFFPGFLIREAVDDQHCRPRTEKKRECKFHNKIIRLSKKSLNIKLSYIIGIVTFQSKLGRHCPFGFFDSPDGQSDTGATKKPCTDIVSIRIGSRFSCFSSPISAAVASSLIGLTRDECDF